MVGPPAGLLSLCSINLILSLTSARTVICLLATGLRLATAVGLDSLWLGVVRDSCMADCMIEV